MSAAGVGCLLAANPARADEPPTEEPVPYEEEIVVSASRRAESVRRLAASVTVVGREVLELSPAVEIDSILEHEVPGFHLVEPGTTSHFGEPQSRAVSLRGLGGSAGSRTLVLLDGVPLIDPLQGSVDWNRIPLANVERVEVVRTATSTAWGNLALGGVIHVITRDPEGTRLSIDTELAEQETVRAEGFAAARRGAHGFTFAGRLFDTAGVDTVHPAMRGPVDERRTVSQESLAAEWHVAAGTGLAVQVGADWSSDQRGEEDLVNTDIIRQAGLRVGGQWVRGSNLWEGRLHGQRMDLPGRRGSVNQARTVVTPNTDQFDAPGSTRGAMVQWSRDFARHSLTAGIDAQLGEMEVHEDFRFQAGRFTRRRAYGGEHRLAGYFVQETFRPKPDWTLHLGVRLDQWRLRDGHQDQLDLETGVRAPTTRFVDRSADVLDPTLGVAYQATPSTALRASLYSGFRAPVLFDLYRAGSNTLRSNPELEPERLRGAEAGVHVDPGGRWSLDLAAYWNEVENPIINRTTGIAGPSGGVVPPCGAIGANATCRQKDNLDELRSRGIEAAVTWRPSPRWDLRWNYAFLDSVVTAARLNPELLGLETRQAPEHSSALSANWSGSRLGLGASVRYVGDRYDDDLNRFALGDFVLLDLHLSRDVGRSLAVFVNGRNLLDDQYVIGDSGSGGLVEIGPPRQIGVGLRLRLAR